MEKGTLYIVATPIGNMGDITKRAVEILSTVDFVACEDTRVAGGLFHQLEIKKEMVSIHQHSSDEKIGFIIRELEAGKSVAYVSDNGTPGISDPGQKLVQMVREVCHPEFISGSNNEIPKQVRNDNTNIQIIPIPGPSAVTAAISVSGMVEKEFYFVGFLPKKKGRETKFKWLKLLDCSIVIYESAIRLEKTLIDIQKYLGENTEVFLAREMTKKFEEYWGGNIAEIINDLKSHTIKGEFVIVAKVK
ncbi:MAG: ribosomal RNA small subunit methyltransferase I [Candidatus Berkelbacteria bacterium]